MRRSRVPLGAFGRGRCRWRCRLFMVRFVRDRARRWPGVLICSLGRSRVRAGDGKSGEQPSGQHPRHAHPFAFWPGVKHLLVVTQAVLYPPVPRTSVSNGLALLWLFFSSLASARLMRSKNKLSTVPRGEEAAALICAVVRRIPKGWVATYGQVATMAGLGKRSRLVGHVLQHLDPATKVPWHRVVNAKGEVSYKMSRNGSDALQQRRLEKEGIEFDNKNRFDLERYRWLD
jgi:methylated-DNA-protein-cysteine methyltransferase-like protein